MSVSKLAASIAESPTLKLNEEAQRLRDKGEAVIHLGAGEPKNKAPINAILGAAGKLNAGDIKYTPTEGIPSLKKAIVRYTEEHYDRAVGAENHQGKRIHTRAEGLLAKDRRQPHQHRRK